MVRETRRDSTCSNCNMVQTVGYWDEEAERAVLAKLLAEEGPQSLTAPLCASHFYDSSYGSIFEKSFAVWRENGSIQPEPLVEAMGGAPEDFNMVGDLLANCPVACIDYFAEKVRRAYTSRQIGEASHRIWLLSRHRGLKSEELLRRAGDILSTIDPGEWSSLVPVEAAGERALVMVEETAMRKETGEAMLSFGWRGLDRLVPELRPGGLCIVAGRPAMGKTTVATNFARRAAFHGKHVLFLSLETTVEDLALNMAAQCARAPVALVDEDPARAREGMRLLIGDVGGSMTLADTGVRTIPDIMRVSARMPQLDVLIVDYLQLLDGPESLRHNPTASIGEVSKGLKRIATSMRCHVMALAQLSRQCELRPDKRPRLADLRQSGQIEQDADLVLMLYRDDYYNPPKPKRTDSPEEIKRLETISCLDIIVAKNRRGECGTAKVQFTRDINLIETPGEWLSQRIRDGKA